MALFPSSFLAIRFFASSRLIISKSTGVKQRNTIYFFNKKGNFFLPLHCVSCSSFYSLNWVNQNGYSLPFVSLSSLFWEVSRLLQLWNSWPNQIPFVQHKFPLCGLYTVQNCTDPVPKLNLGTPGVFYDLNSTNVQENSVWVNDPRLGNLIRTNGCDIFSFYFNWTLPVRPSISFTISPGITLFKCTTISPELDKQQDAFFHGNDSYRGCSGYTVYYKYPHHYLVQSNGSFLPNCSVIELPVVLELRSRNSSDLFSVLASVFSIKFHVSKECFKCRHKGGQCAGDRRHFSCIKEKEGNDI